MSNTKIPAKMLVAKPVNSSNTSVFSSTAPTTFTNLDLSATIGAQVCLVILKVTNGGAATTVLFRPNGATNGVGFSDAASNGCGASGGSVNNGYDLYVVVPTGTGGVLEWMAAAANTITIRLVGYIPLS